MNKIFIVNYQQQEKEPGHLWVTCRSILIEHSSYMSTISREDKTTQSKIYEIVLCKKKLEKISALGHDI